MKGEPKTISTADVKRIRCATRTMMLEWQTDRFIWTVSCKVVRLNKFWNEKIHGWFHSHFLNVNLTFKPKLSNLKPLKPEPGGTNLFETKSYFLVQIHAKGYQFDTSFWNRNLPTLPSIKLYQENLKIFINLKTLIMFMLLFSIKWSLN